MAVGDSKQKDFATSHNEDIMLQTDQIKAIVFSMPKELYTSIDESDRISYMNAAALYSNNKISTVENAPYQEKLDSMLQKFGGLMCMRFVMMSETPFSVGGQMQETYPMLKNMISMSGEPSLMFVSMC